MPVTFVGGTDGIAAGVRDVYIPWTPGSAEGTVIIASLYGYTLGGSPTVARQECDSPALSREFIWNNHGWSYVLNAPDPVASTFHFYVTNNANYWWSLAEFSGAEQWNPYQYGGSAGTPYTWAGTPFSTGGMLYSWGWNNYLLGGSTWAQPSLGTGFIEIASNNNVASAGGICGYIPVDSSSDVPSPTMSGHGLGQRGYYGTMLMERESKAILLDRTAVSINQTSVTFNASTHMDALGFPMTASIHTKTLGSAAGGAGVDKVNEVYWSGDTDNQFVKATAFESSVAVGAYYSTSPPAGAKTAVVSWATYSRAAIAGVLMGGMDFADAASTATGLNGGNNPKTHSFTPSGQTNYYTAAYTQYSGTNTFGGETKQISAYVVPSTREFYEGYWSHMLRYSSTSDPLTLSMTMVASTKGGSGTWLKFVGQDILKQQAAAGTMIFASYPISRTWFGRSSFAGVVSPDGEIAGKDIFLGALSGVLEITSRTQRVVYQVFNGALTAVGDVYETIKNAVEGTVTPVGAITGKTITTVMGGVLEFSVFWARGVIRPFFAVAGAMGFTGDITGMMPKIALEGVIEWLGQITSKKIFKPGLVGELFFSGLNFVNRITDFIRGFLRIDMAPEDDIDMSAVPGSDAGIYTHKGSVEVSGQRPSTRA